METPNQDVAPDPTASNGDSVISLNSGPNPNENVHSQPPQASPSVGAAPSPARIPKKNQPNIELLASADSKLPQPPFEHNRSDSFDNGSLLVLPDGVQLPLSVNPQMLEGRLKRIFFELSPAQVRISANRIYEFAIYESHYSFKTLFHALETSRADHWIDLPSSICRESLFRFRG